MLFLAKTSSRTQDLYIKDHFINNNTHIYIKKVCDDLELITIIDKALIM